MQVTGSVTFEFCRVDRVELHNCGFYGTVSTSVVTHSHGMLPTLWLELKHTLSQPSKKVPKSIAINYLTLIIT